jgi:septum formation protein
MSTSANPSKVILASASPRRHELLEQAGVVFSIKVSGCDETPVPGESAREMVERLALVKARAVAEGDPQAFVLGADTTVSIDGESLGKPESFQDACLMLQKIQGKTHEVWGGIAVVCLAQGLIECWSHKTYVTMRPMSDEAIKRYVETGEPLDKAGSYAIQGIGLQFVDSINGSYSNVVGLNVAAVMEKLRTLGAL